MTKPRLLNLDAEWKLHQGDRLYIILVTMLLGAFLLADLFGNIGDARAGRACNERGGEYVKTTNGHVCIEVRRL